MNKITLINGKKNEEYKLLFSFVNSDDEKFIVYTDGKKDEEGMIYAYIGKKEENNLLNNVEDKDIEIALELLEKIEKDD